MKTSGHDKNKDRDKKPPGAPDRTPVENPERKEIPPVKEPNPEKKRIK